MTYWKRDDVKELFTDLGCWIKEEPPMGGFYDITSIYLTPEGTEEWVRIVPFTVDPEGIAGIDDACEIYAIEVRTDGDDRGGMQTEDEKIAKLYMTVCKRLRDKGFMVVNTLDNYF